MSLLDDLRKLFIEGNELEPEFNRLSKDTPEFEQWWQHTLDWLNRCVAYGRYLDDGSPDRRALQGRVDYWTSLLGMHGITVDIDRIAKCDLQAGVPLDADSPYPGLKAYDESWHGAFYGRDTETDVCVARIIANRILVIIGGSGSGKSSLALAGVLPKLKNAQPDWQIINPFTPGVNPFESLASALANTLDRAADAKEIAKKLLEHSKNAQSVLEELFGSSASIFLLIDQFEELFTICTDPVEQEAFSSLLCGLLSQSGSVHNSSADFSCRMLLTLRTDHQTRFEDKGIPLYRYVTGIKESHGIFSLSPIGFVSIREAIDTPARKVGLRFLPPKLIDALANQAASLVDGLPLLQFALERLWDLRPSSPPVLDDKGTVIEPARKLDFINQETFDKLPDVQGALGKVAEQIYLSLDSQQKELCERLMLELVLLDENFEQPLRRRRPKKEILNILVQEWPEEAVDQVIKAFLDQGLLRKSGDNNAVFEVAHEAMFRNWPTFREWIGGSKTKTRLHAIKSIGREADEWQNHAKSQDYLKLTGEPLKAAQQYVSEYWLMDQDVKEYVEASIKKGNWKKWQNGFAIFFGVAFLAILLSAAAYFRGTSESERKAALASLPWIISASQAQPWKALDAAYSVAKKTKDEQFSNYLAQALEKMENYDLLMSGKGSYTIIAGQGSVVLNFDETNDKKKVLKIFRLCHDGRLDRDDSVKIDYDSKLLAPQANISPVNGNSETDTRLLVLPFINNSNNHTDIDVEIYRIDWHQSPCTQGSQTANLVEIDKAKKTIENNDNISTLAFSYDGSQVAFSSIAYSPSIKSTVWVFNGANETWSKRLQLSDTTDSHEDVVSAVAFFDTQNHDLELITGRFSGALYCGNKQRSKSDDSPIQQLAFSHTSDWIIQKHQSGKIVASKCYVENKKTLSESQIKGEVSSLFFHDINFPAQGLNKPVLSYLIDNQPECWVIESDEWEKENCVIGAAVDSFVVNRDRNATAIELNEEHTRVAVRRFPQILTNSGDDEWDGRTINGRMISWPKRESVGTASETSWKSSGDAGKVIVINGKPANGVKIVRATLSPDGQYIAWLESKSGVNEFDLHVAYKEDKAYQFHRISKEELKKTNTFDLAITDKGLVILGFNDVLRLYDLNGTKLDEQPFKKPLAKSQEKNTGKLPVNDPNITCLGLSNNNEFLAIGTKGGQLAYFNLSEKEIKPNRIQFIHWYPSPSVTSCAVDSKGEKLVGGYDNGDVWIALPKADPNDPPKVNPYALKSPASSSRINKPVKAVNIDEQMGYVSALFDTQNAGACGTVDLDGQVVRIWGLDLDEQDKSFLISNQCLLNHKAITLGRLNDSDNPFILPVLFDDKSVDIPCRACSDKNDKPGQMLNRLIKQAEDKGAQNVDLKLYGIKLQEGEVDQQWPRQPISWL